MKNNLDKYQILFDKIKTINFDKFTIEDAKNLRKEIKCFKGNCKINLLLAVIDTQVYYYEDPYKKINRKIFSFLDEIILNLFFINFDGYLKIK